MKNINTQRYLYNFLMAIEAVTTNKFRSFLTTLGIIFGVGAVISMLAIGKGARKEIIDQMKYIGVNNIMITPKKDIDQSQKEGDKSMKKKYSTGLTIADANALINIIPTIKKVSSEVTYDVPAIFLDKSMNVKLYGVDVDFFDIFNIALSNGTLFNQEQLINGSPVCIIGSNIKAKFFTNINPLGKYIKCGNINLKIIGVIENMATNTSSENDYETLNYNDGVYAPLQAILLRYKDRSVVTKSLLNNKSQTTIVNRNNVTTFYSESDESSITNQLDRIVAHVDNTENIEQTSELISRIIKRRHSDMDDFSIIVPELLLKQEQRTKDIFNLVLGAIASISLIVGGIGIMNIMLASVLERTKEIGTRLAIGAKKTDIIFQFLSEATIISLTGGLLGILLGVIIAKTITSITGIVTIISFSSILISFGVSATIGIIFGYMPAKKAAYQNPVESLHYE